MKSVDYFRAVNRARRMVAIDGLWRRGQLHRLPWRRSWAYSVHFEY